MANEQQKYVEQLLVDWRQRRRDALGGLYANRAPGYPKPPRVAEAQKKIKFLQHIVSTWEHAANAAHKKALAEIDARYRVAREKILFSNPKDALAFVKKLK